MSPDSLRESSNKNLKSMTTEVRSGNWDREAAPLSDSRIYDCVRRLLRSSQPEAPEWEKQWLDSPQSETALDRALTEEAGGEKGLTERAISTVARWIKSRTLTEIPVRVGRQGQLLCTAHAPSVITLCIAQLAGCSEVDGIVSVRHKSWQRIRKQYFVLAGSAFSEGHGSLYQQLWHPDLMDVPHLHKGDERIQCIEEAAKRGGTGNALDIGANLGFFCHRLEDLGFQCYAIENNAIIVDHMRLLRDIEGKAFSVSYGNILGRDMDEICSRQYELVLALSIFHHFLKQEKTYKALKLLLKNLKTERLVLQTHNPEEGQMIGAFKNLEPEEFADHILDMSCLTKRELIGKAPHGRLIFLLSKK